MRPLVWFPIGAALAYGIRCVRDAKEQERALLDGPDARTSPKLKKGQKVCIMCDGARFQKCSLCAAQGFINWSPNPQERGTVLAYCPACHATRRQMCLNCLGKGFTV
mmetsp:Transcript_11634/g.42546  ORF Transcript_11634/g.42546 Transcript_11634/m.42546 type:complete len:107 (-) Transcript_11634:1163-1483(-)